jgi:hypothetical protein
MASLAASDKNHMRVPTRRFGDDTLYIGSFDRLRDILLITGEV